MSTGKRLAKRSIVGTKVVVLREDGLYYPGIIQAVKTAEMDPSRGQLFSHTKYAVRSIMETAGHPGRQQLLEYSEVDLIGPGFQSTAGLTLQPGQKVYITFTGREVAGHVTKHRPDVDEVHITLQVSNSNSVDIVKRMEEVRLMESRKSLRLMDQHDVDFARLAEGVVGGLTASVNGHQDCSQSNHHQISVGNPPRKRCSSASTSGIDVPGAFFGSRKRRSSPSSANGAADVIMDEDEDSDVMDECAAAMVLMRLSCSPHSPRWEDVAAWQQSNHSSSSSSGAFSWRGSVSSSSDSPPHASSSSSGSTGAAGRVLPVGTGRKLKFRSATPSPPLMSGSAPANFSGSLNKFHPGAPGAPVAKNAQDDGIVSDESISECDEGPSPSQVRTIYQCTWPGCLTTTDNCEAIETHVRSIHLGPRQIDEEISDHEEEFYYTEVEEEGDEEIADQQSTTLPPMAEVVESSVAQTQSFQQPHPGWMASSPPTLSHMDMARPPHEDPEYQRALMKARPIAIPARVRSISWSSGYGYGSNALKQAKVVVSPKTSPSPAPPTAPPSTTGASVFTVKSSPVRRPRGEAKKCRKVYGMEHREQWCTQCKWKKACTRFGE